MIIDVDYLRRSLIEEFEEILESVMGNLPPGEMYSPLDYNENIERKLHECVSQISFNYLEYPTAALLIAVVELYERNSEIDIDQLFPGTIN